MMYQKEAFAVGREHQAGASDMARSKLGARERRGRALQKHEDEFATLKGRAVGEIAEEMDEGVNVSRTDHKLMVCACDARALREQATLLNPGLVPVFDTNS